MDLQYILITPEMASQWLKTSNGNPRWRTSGKLTNPDAVMKIRDDIINGRWNPGNASIAFDSGGKLVDGHHRLSAIVAAGIPVYSIVVRGISEKGLQHIDDNHVRTIHQRLGVDNLIPAVANIHFWSIGSLTKSSETSEAISVWINQHPLVFTARSAAGQGADISICRKSGVVHGALCALECGESEHSIFNFMRIANSGFAEGQKESSAIVLRNMLLRNKYFTRSDKLLLTYATQSAIHDFVNGIPRKREYTSKTGCYFDKLVLSGNPNYKK